ncbi:hypothetical protein ACFWUU_23870 [Kribbella sp. NPDC058693]|uniref:hypothetical protein n=1 Tax=Kribbella sp. NPDC058693 TaxID=3346602 RepID=UPI003666CA5F
MGHQNARVRLLKLERLPELEQDSGDSREDVEAHIKNLRLLKRIVLGQGIQLRKHGMLAEAWSHAEEILDRHCGWGR